MEAKGMRAIRVALGETCPIPLIIDHDPENFVTVMTAAPRSATRYDEELLAGRFHDHVAGQIGTYAARLHIATMGDTTLERDFSTNPGFQLRDQGIRSAIPLNPDLGDQIESCLARVRTTAEALTDADITPKNVLVHGDAITKLDFECLTFGDTAFDLGVVLADVLLIAFPRSDHLPRLIDQAHTVHAAYARCRPLGDSGDFIRRTTEYVAVMMLGRVDGDFRPGHLVPYRFHVNALARRLLGSSIDDARDLFAVVESHVPTEKPLDKLVLDWPEGLS
jgi:hypothetical protein